MIDVNYWRDQRGGALIFTLLVLTVLVLLGTGLLTLARAETNMANYNYKETAAFYLAESGLVLGRAFLAREPQSQNIESEVGDAGVIQIAIEKQEDMGVGKAVYEILSIGQKDRVRVTLVEELTVTDHLEVFLSWEETVIAGGTVDIGGNAEVEGEWMGGGEVPHLDIGAYSALADKTVTAEEVAGLKVDGIVYVPGDVKLSGDGSSVTGEGVLIVDGELDLGGQAYLDGNLLVLAAGDIKLRGAPKDGKVTGIIYTLGDFSFNGPGTVQGKIIAGGDVSLKGSAFVEEYSGDLFHDLPRVLVEESMWYYQRNR